MTDTASVPQADYIRAYMSDRPVLPGRSALLVIDMQYATGSREGALGRKLAAQKSNAGDYRFERIETMVLPNTQRLLAGFRKAGHSIVYVTIGARLPDASDAPAHMQNLFRELGNHAGSRDHEILDVLTPRPGELVINKTTIGAFASSGIDSL